MHSDTLKVYFKEFQRTRENWAELQCSIQKLEHFEKSQKAIIFFQSNPLCRTGTIQKIMKLDVKKYLCITTGEPKKDLKSIEQ